MFTSTKKKLFGLITFLLLALQGIGQDLRSAQELLSKANKYRDINIDSMAILSQQVLELVLKTNYYQEKVDALTNLGFARYVKGDTKGAIEYYNKACAVGEGTNSLITRHYLAQIYLSQRKNEEVIEILTALFEEASAEGNLYLMADICMNLGIAHLNLKNYEKSYEYFHTAINLMRSVDYRQSEIYADLNLGHLFVELQMYDSAAVYLNFAADIGKSLKNDRALIHVYMQLGQLHSKIGENTIAANYFSQASDIAEAYHLDNMKTPLLLELGESHFNDKKYQKSIALANEVLRAGPEKLSSAELEQANALLIKSYIRLGDVKSAESRMDSFSLPVDSISESDTASLFRSVIQANRLKEADFKLIALKQELDLAKSNIIQRNIIILASISITALTVIILMLISRSNRIKSRNNKLLVGLNREITEQKSRLEIVNSTLERNNKEKDLLLAMVAHDLRQPLGRISALIELLHREPENTAGRSQIENMVISTVNDAHSLVDELVQISQIESGTVEPLVQSLELLPYIQHIVSSHQITANSKNITINLTSNITTAAISTDKRILQRILDNLLTNAIKFSERDSNISLNIVEESGHMWFSVKDQGKGVAVSEHDRLFTKFGKTSTRPTAGESSTGLGLFIVKRLTHLLGGSISFTSEEGQGSEFVISFPVSAPS